MKYFVGATILAQVLGTFLVNNYVKQQEVGTYNQKLQRIADIVNNSNTTWKAGIDKRFENQTEESVKNFFMRSEFMMTNELHASKAIKYTKEEHLEAPESFDSRSQWSGCSSIGESRDQSRCGSCWAFGAAEVMTDRLCIGSAQMHNNRVSAEDLLECCSGCGNGCNGGYPSAAFDYWKTTGVVTGGNYMDSSTCKPYAFPPCAHHTDSGSYEPCGTTHYDTPTCTKSCKNGDDYTKSKTYGLSSYTLFGEDDMKADISKNGPIEVAFTVYEDFLTYQSGVYQHKEGSALGGHAVKMIGYGEENGTKYWIIMNSWNESWGDFGSFKILRGSGECGIESSGSAGLPA